MTKDQLTTGWRTRLSGLLAAGFVLALIGGGSLAAAPPPTSCTAPSHPVSGLTASIDTSGGCNNPNGTATYPVTGYVAYNPGAGTSVQLFNGYEGLSTHKFYWGTYVFCLYPTYGTVSQQCSTYTVTQNTGSYPNTVPTFSGTLPTITGGADGSFVAQYTLTVQNEPTGQLNSSKADFWVLKNGAAIAHTATQSVKPPTLTVPPPAPNIYLGYADTYRPTGTGLPSIWKGSPGVIFVGCGVNANEDGPAIANTCPQEFNGPAGDSYDGGAIRIDNTMLTTALVVTGPASVSIGNCPNGSPALYTPWPGLKQTIPPGGTLILTQTGLTGDPCGQNLSGNYNFDTSESSGNSNCIPSGAIPEIKLTIGGTPTTILDTAQLLNTKGIDLGACGSNPYPSELQEWTALT
jgi:hypothetical protein